MDKPVQWLPSLSPKHPDLKQILESLGALYVSGEPVNWQEFYKDYSFRKVVLPNYPFQRERYWIESGDISQKSEVRSQKSEERSKEIKNESQQPTANSQQPLELIMSEQIRTMSQLMAQQLEILGGLKNE